MEIIAGFPHYYGYGDDYHLSEDRQSPPKTRNQSHSHRKGLVNHLPGLKRKGSPGTLTTVVFHGERRSNQTHESTTDAEAKLARKGPGKEAKLSYSGHLLVENRNGLIVEGMAWEANGTAERDAALVMLEQIPGDGPVTVGGDKGYDTRDFVKECRHMKVTLHVAQNDNRPGGSALDERTTRAQIELGSLLFGVT